MHDETNLVPTPGAPGDATPGSRRDGDLIRLQRAEGLPATEHRRRPVRPVGQASGLWRCEQLASAHVAAKPPQALHDMSPLGLSLVASSHRAKVARKEKRPDPASTTRIQAGRLPRSHTSWGLRELGARQGMIPLSTPAPPSCQVTPRCCAKFKMSAFAKWNCPPVVPENSYLAILRDISTSDVKQPSARSGDADRLLLEPRLPHPGRVAARAEVRGNPWPVTDACANGGNTGSSWRGGAKGGYRSRS